MESHLTAVKRILQYLKGTLNLVLQYHGTGKNLMGYSDANWASDLGNCHSTSSRAFVMSGGDISRVAEPL